MEKTRLVDSDLVKSDSLCTDVITDNSDFSLKVSCSDEFMKNFKETSLKFMIRMFFTFAFVPLPFYAYYALTNPDK